MAKVSAAQFVSALKEVGMPTVRELRFLRAHYDAPGRAATATVLAEKAGYKGFGGVNLRYGILAGRIGTSLRIPGARLSLLVDFVRPPSLTNKEWILVMRPEFAQGLKRTRWI